MNSKDDKNNSKFTSVILRKSGSNITAKYEAVLRKNHNFQSGNPGNDKRVQLTKYFIAVVFLVSVVGIFTADKVLVEILPLVVMFFILVSINYIGFFALKNDLVGSLVFSLLSLYIWVAFPFKLIIAMNYPEALWVSKILFDSKVVEQEIADSFLIVFPALPVLLLGMFLFHRSVYKKNNYVITKIYHTRFIVVIVFLMCLRVFSQVFLDIGIPGVKPSVLPVPYLSGVLDLVSRPVLLALVNLYFYYNIRSNSRNKIWISLLLLLVNIILGLRVGYKSELVIQGVLLLYYLIEAYPYLSKINRKFLTTVTATLMLIVVVVYPLVNHYRNLILSGVEYSEAVDIVRTRSDKNSTFFGLSFVDRVNGIAEFYAATKLAENREFGVDALFTNSATDLIKERLYGTNKNNVVTSFGITIFSVIYLVGGSVFLLVFCFVLGWLIRWSVIYLKCKVLMSNLTHQAYLPILCIFWIKLLAFGGNILLPMKELLLVVLCIFLLERYGTSSKIQ